MTTNAALSDNAHLFASAPDIRTVDVLANKLPSTGPEG